MKNVVLIPGDCAEEMRHLDPSSIDSAVTDPPYGLEFMSCKWDTFVGDHVWKTGAGFSKPGIGERKTSWPSFSGANDVFGGANPTCQSCGGRARGKKKCSCVSPDWRVCGKEVDRSYGRHRQMLGYQASMSAVFKEALRVLKPGGYLLAFGGTRTYHRLTCAIEDAGFEVCGSLHWAYGSGFPKSLDISKSIDKSLGVEREVVSVGKGRTGKASQPNGTSTFSDDSYQWPGVFPITAPATDAAKQLDGWGTALKPAHEPIVVARKPLAGHVPVGSWTSELDAGLEVPFFYCAKAATRERDVGIRVGRNIHPTVKPVEVMRWLVRLATPPNGVVLDPFMGSGTTGMACVLEGFNFVGIELDSNKEGYVDIARSRINYAIANRLAILESGSIVCSVSSLKPDNPNQQVLF